MISREDRIRRLKEEANTYRDSLNALVALSHELRFDDEGKSLLENARFDIGRRLTTSRLNPIITEQEVTPDAVVQLNPNLGHVIEVKLTFPDDERRRNEHIEQVSKYDDDLVGWPLGNGHCSMFGLIWVVHATRQVQATNYLKSRIESGEVVFAHPMALMGYSEIYQDRQFLNFEKRYGDLVDSAKDEKFTRGSVPIPMERIKALYSHIELYDTEPPAPYMMDIVYHAINGIEDTDNLIEGKLTGKRELRISLDELTQALRVQMGFGAAQERQRSIPETKWVKCAMENFVELAWARKGAEDGSYVFEIKERRDFENKLFNHCAEKREAEEQAKQEKFPLFANQLED